MGMRVLGGGNPWVSLMYVECQHNKMKITGGHGLKNNRCVGNAMGGFHGKFHMTVDSRTPTVLHPENCNHVKVNEWVKLVV